ncbi:MAG TPA: HAMP domain-containing protein, partial [Pyrinomonadaceae bacterium]
MSLYLKVFLWFWLATALVIGALAFASYATRGERAMQPPQFVVGIMSAYARHAVETFEREGPAALDAFLGRLEQEANVRGRLFDAGGAELAGRAATEEEQELAARAARAGSTVSRMSGGRVIDAFPWPGRGGRGFVFVATMSRRPSAPDGQTAPARRPFPPPGPFGFLLGESTAALAARLVAALLTAGVLCYGLARYIVSPVVKLRAVTRQVAGGDLSARVGPLLGGRSDELGAMGRDFDAMAARIEA